MRFTEKTMMGGQAFRVCFAGGVALAALGACSHADAREGCRAPKVGTREAPMVSPPLAVKVTGVGRLHFYAAPNFRCGMDGVFVIPKDQLIEYANRDDGWSSVMYDNFKTENSIVEGWVRSARLKVMFPVGPKQ